MSEELASAGAASVYRPPPEPLASAGAASVYVPPVTEPAVPPTILPARAPVSALPRLLPPVFKHEKPTANPSKGFFGALARSVGATSNNRLILKPTQLSHNRFDELGYDGVFGRYYRLAHSYLSGEKGTPFLSMPVPPSKSIQTAFMITGNIRIHFFENLKRALAGVPEKDLPPIHFRPALADLRKLPDLPESLRDELAIFLYMLEDRYEIELDKIRRDLRGATDATRRRRKERKSRRKYTRRH